MSAPLTDAASPPAPTGTVTFLFTDIEGSTRLARRDAVAWEAARAAQHSLSAEAWGDTPVRVRMGLHTGAADAYAGQYRGYLTLVQVQ